MKKLKINKMDFLFFDVTKSTATRTTLLTVKVLKLSGRSPDLESMPGT